MQRREFLQLAHVYNPDKHTINGWFYSEKLDGMRAFWDGGLTRGMWCDEIPFANTAKDPNRRIASGLWSRQSKPIQAPNWFLDSLPKYPLDGELTAGRGLFQETMSTCRTLVPNEHMWGRITYNVFDLPDYGVVFQDGRINTPGWTSQFSNIIDWIKSLPNCQWTPNPRRFETVVFLLNKHLRGHDIIKVVDQIQLPFTTAEAKERLDIGLDSVLKLGGEGLILRNLNSVWEPKRTNNCLKVKSSEDCEVTVTGYISGRETDRGSKLLGLMGAMVVDFNGKRLELSGFTDHEREFSKTGSSLGFAAASEWCEQNPGQVVPDWIESTMFPRGSRVTIRYRELTNDGLPKEARYYRKRPEE